MARQRRYHPAFAADLSAANVYYDKISADLGNRFRSMVRLQLAAIAERPALFGRIHDNIRACMVNRFPYMILYEDQDDAVFMLGIYHVASDQGVWFKRSIT